MSSQKRRIMVVRRAVLFKSRSFRGFLPAASADLRNLILSEASYLERASAEQDPAYKQPIGYAVVLDPAGTKVFAYRRAPHEAYAERRLRGLWSWGVGGHVEEEDSGAPDPIAASLRRELREEVGMSGNEPLWLLGYINDDDTEVGSVHFGLLYVAKSRSDSLSPSSPELAEGEFVSPEKIEKLLAAPEESVEAWSRIAWPAVLSFMKTGRM